MKNNNKTRLLVLMPSMVGGGAERILINIFNNLSSSQYLIDLVVLEKKGKLWDAIPRHVNKRIIKLPNILSKIGQILYRKYGWTLLLKYYASKITGNYDVGLSYFDSLYNVLLYSSKAFVTKKIAAIHSSYRSYDNRSRFIKGSHFKRMMQRYNEMDHIICVSNEVEKEFNSFFKQNSKTQVIYNPMNSEDVISKSNSSKIILDSKDVFHFSAIGSLIPVKGFELLIDAARLLKEDGLNFKLNIIGSGQLKEKLSELILDYDLQNFVKLWGFQSNPYGILKESDALVISSKTEGLPTVLCEAMILGKACIVPDITGCREVSNNGEFALQVDRTPQGFFQGMKSIIEDAELRKKYENKSKQRSVIFDDTLAINNYIRLFKEKK
tara:strand:+ start:106 stop:1251 length:1146 start_codon:yes stop_codon:yes gene_type:complete